MKPRYGANVDGPQRRIVAALECAGAKVLVLDVSEAGAPDLLVCWLGAVTLLEVKGERGRLRPGQVEWRDSAAKRGVRVHLVRSPGEAMAACGMTGERAAENERAMRELATALLAEQREAARVRQVRGRLRPAIRPAGGQP